MTPARDKSTGHKGTTHRGNRLHGFGAAVILAGIVVIALGGQPAVADEDLDGNLTVDVTDGLEPTPLPTSTPSPPSQSPVTSSVTQATIPDPAAADEALGDDAIETGGMLFMSGLRASASPSFAVGNGSLTLDFVVRNTSDTTFDATAHFWVNNAFGGRLADVDGVDVDDLEPDETRRVLVTIDGLGQHFVLRPAVTLTPPKIVDGVALVPLTRNSVVWLPPLLSITLVSVVGAIGGLSWWLFSQRGFGLRFRRLGV